MVFNLLNNSCCFSFISSQKLSKSALILPPSLLILVLPALLLTLVLFVLSVFISAAVSDDACVAFSSVCISLTLASKLSGIIASP